MSPRAQHLHTYFLFPFAIDKETVKQAHPDVWPGDRRWLEGLDKWIERHSGENPGRAEHLGPWRRDAYRNFDLESQAYQDVMFFHPFTRRAFFDVTLASGPSEDALVRCYTIPRTKGATLWFEASDIESRTAKLEVTDIRMFLFANGIGLLSIGAEACDLKVAEALWINESLRKVYPSSAQQIRAGRIPDRVAFVLEREGGSQTIAEHSFLECKMTGMLPPLAKTITGLLYFLDYLAEEFEPVLDERMVVYSYMAIDPASVPDDYHDSEDYLALVTRFLYVDWDGESFRYDPEFVREALKTQLYTRWAHQGTYYGFTSYSNIAVTLGKAGKGDYRQESRLLIHRMFTTRYYMMAAVALFYRATLLDFMERTSLVSKRLYLDQGSGEFDVRDLRMTDGLRSEFLQFCNHWHFTELANKEEEIEHFDLQCKQYRTETIMAHIAEELNTLNASLHSYYQFRSAEAVNRLGMLSMIVGVGAVATGFFGMNFESDAMTTLLKGQPGPGWLHSAAFVLVTLITVGSMLFGSILVAANWSDYRDTLLPNRWKLARAQRRLTKRGSSQS